MNNKDKQKVLRGQVWFIEEITINNGQNNTSSVQNGSRPWLILSCEENNQNADTFNCVPITTKLKNLPCHVDFNNGGKQQQILCEQITTKSMNDLNAYGNKYLYTLDNRILNKVDIAIKNQLGIKTTETAIPGLIELEKIIVNIINDRFEQAKTAVEKKHEELTDNTVSNIANKLNALFSTIEEVKQNDNKKQKITEENKAITLTKTSSNIDYANYKPPAFKKKINDEKKENKPVSSRIKWTEEKMRQLLEDYKTLTLDAVVEKYNFKSKKVASQNRYLAQIKIDEIDNKK